MTIKKQQGACSRNNGDSEEDLNAEGELRGDERKTPGLKMKERG